MSDVSLDADSLNALFQGWRDLMKQRNENISRFIGEADGIIRKQTQELKHDFQRLLSECKGPVHRIENNTKISASRFNIFDALGVTRREIVQSRFLAFLLSPLEHHDQGTTFLNAFLQEIDVPAIAENDKKRVMVRTEVSAGKFGQMDIVISTSTLLIVVENKVDAAERYGQLADYQEWMNSQTGQANKVIVFLTPTGCQSMTGQSRSLSYAAMADAFEAALKDIEAIPERALPLREVMKQYIACCRSITTGGLTMTSPNEDLINIITQSENIKVALELEQQTAFARKAIASKFCEHVTKYLDELIKGDPALSVKWRVQRNVQSPYDIEIATKRHNANRPNYSLRAEYIFTDSDKGRVGWHRPKYIEPKPSDETNETKSLTERMVNAGCYRDDGWWVGFRPLRGGIKKGYVLSDNDDIVACLEDNRSAEHPLAREMAQDIWEMFSEYIAGIESLGSFRQADSQ
jgi:hypothetical protein